MDQRNEAALRQWGAKKILSDLVNIPAHDYDLRRFVNSSTPPAPGDIERASKFVERYGPLRRCNHAVNNDLVAALDVVLMGAQLRSAWTAAEDEDAARGLNLTLDGIFSYEPKDAAFLGERPVFAADFCLGKWTPTPRTLIDALAIELMRSRKMLHRCERPECSRYFVKEFSRDRYCSMSCSDTMRKVGQREWAREHRGSAPVQGKVKKEMKTSGKVQ